MAKCQSEATAGPGASVQQPPLPVLCLLPEFKPFDGTETPELQKRISAVRGAYTRFASRCEVAYVLSTGYGLLPFEDDTPLSNERFDDLSNDKRHAWIINVKAELTEAWKAHQTIVCLAGGSVLKALRRMELPISAPLAGMSEPQRRRWLERFNFQSPFAVGLACGT
jgi:hypothetical protein